MTLRRAPALKLEGGAPWWGRSAAGSDRIRGFLMTVGQESGQIFNNGGAPYWRPP